MIKRKYRYMRICADRIDFADVENTITYSLCPDKLEKNLNKREDELCNKISDLEAKLAEKEKENELMAKTLRMTKFIDKEINQAKISFALEQLEKVKETLIKNADEIGEEYKEDYFMISLGNVKNIINNQIKELKEGK